MICPKCGSVNMSRVTNSRCKEDGVHRRRECVLCGCRYSTMEKVSSVRQYRKTKEKRNETA